MTHPVLFTALHDRALSQSARSLISYLYAHTNGTLRAAVAVENACADLGLAESSLRRRRAELADAGYLASERDGDVLRFEILERAPTARCEDANAHLLCVERAPSARLDDNPAPERAPTARSLPRAERENPAPPPDPPIGIVNLGGGRINLPPNLPVAREADRSAGLLAAAGIDPSSAAEIAGRLTFRTVVRFVAAWQIDTTARGPGALLYRLRKWPEPATRFTAEDLTDGVLAGHVTDRDLDAWHVPRPRNILAGYDVPAGYEALVRS